MRKCPYCAEEIREDASQCNFCKSILESDKFNDTKKCPYCAEKIQYEAIKCKYCGTDLSKELKKIPETHSLPALLSFFVPGLGQIIKGQIGRGVGIFLGTILSFVIFGIFGIIVHVWNIYDAYNESVDNPQRTIFTRSISIPKKYEKIVITILTIFIIIVVFTIAGIL